MKINILLLAIGIYMVLAGIYTISEVAEKEEIIEHQNAAIAESIKIMKDLVIEIETKNIIIDILENGCLEEVDYR